MLPADFHSRLNEMMGVKWAEISKETQEAFARDSAYAAQKGMVHSGNTLGLNQMKRLQQINKRIEAVLGCQKRLIAAMHIPFTDTLASELKEQAKAWVTEEWCEQSIQSDPNLGLVKDYKPEFREETLNTKKYCPQKSVHRDRFAR